MRFAPDVHRDRDRVAPHLLPHVGWALTVLEQPRRESVSKIVEADTSNARLDDRTWSPFRRASFDRSAGSRRNSAASCLFISTRLISKVSLRQRLHRP